MTRPMKKSNAIFAFLLLFNLIITVFLNLNAIYTDSNDKYIIYIANFDNFVDHDIAKNILYQTRKNLEGSGFFSFKFNDNKGKNLKFEDIDLGRVQKDKLIDIIVHGFFEKDGDKLVMIIRLYDIKSQKEIIKKIVKINEESAIRLANIASNLVYNEYIDEGYFDTDIFYLKDQDINGQSHQNLLLTDFSGTNEEIISLTDRDIDSFDISINQEYITYNYHDRYGSHVVVRNVSDESDQYEQYEITDKINKFLYPRFSPTRKEVVLSFVNDGYSNLYSYNWKDNKQTILTRTAKKHNKYPSYNMSGTDIVFTSDMKNEDGNDYENIFVLNLKTKKTSQLTIGATYYYPTYSPDDKYIAFIKRYNSSNYLGFMDSNGENERILTKDVAIDRINWSDNGNNILYKKNNLNSSGIDDCGNDCNSINIINVDNLFQYQIDIDGVKNPLWIMKS